MKYPNALLVSIMLMFLVSCHSQSGDQSLISIKTDVSEKTEDVVFGAEDATNAIYMYASYHCNFCRYFFSRTFPELKSNFIDKGKLKLVVKFVDFDENPQIMKALQTASCISRFGVYQKYHELLMVNPDVVFTEDFAELVDEIMQNNPEIEECVLSDPEFTYLKSNVKEFRENNLSGTPTFIINKHVYSGFISYENFVKLIEKEFETN